MKDINMKLLIMIMLITISYSIFSQEKRNLAGNFAQTSQYLIAENDEGQKTKFRIEYFAYSEGKMWQTGHNSRPLEGDFTDTRKCNWNISGNIQRKVLIESAIGVEGEYKPLSKVFTISDIGDLGADNPIEGLFYARACNTAATTDFDVRYVNFKKALEKKLPSIKELERKTLDEDLKAAFKVTKISTAR
tara:strand:- start:3133 stop:3702 length:570 start_codon:yes stop_codon:yes gene_type:complete